MSGRPDMAQQAAIVAGGEPHSDPSVDQSREPGRGTPRVELEWGLRVLFGLLLAAAALATMIGGGAWFAAFIAAGAIAGAREWHRMIAHGPYRRYLAVSAFAIAAALALPLVRNVPAGWPEPAVLSLWVLAAGAVLNLALGAAFKAGPLWQAAGPLYLGIPAVALFDLRVGPDHGLWLVLLLFLAVWASDTGALVSGKAIGGPKLAPTWSPNKTWAGLIGGIMVAAVTAALVLAILHMSVLRGAAFGAAAALVGQAGDMFESWVKRRVGRKNSGSLIPGHGGVLDRIDSILFAAPACAFLVYLLGTHAVLGVQP